MLLKDYIFGCLKMTVKEFAALIDRSDKQVYLMIKKGYTVYDGNIMYTVMSIPESPAQWSNNER